MKLSSALIGMLAGCLMSGAASLALAACTGADHIVAPGETLEDIARQYSPLDDAANTIHAINYDGIGPDASSLAPGTPLTIICPFPDINANWWIVVGPALVAPMQDLFDAQIVDIRGGVREEDPVAPGSINLPYDRWHGRNEPDGPMRSDAELSQLIGDAGLHLDRPIILMHARNSPHSMGRAAYVYWILKSLGAERISIVASGFDGWLAEGRPVTEEKSKPESYVADLYLSQQWRAGAEQIRDIVFGDGKGLLLDGSFSPTYSVDRRGRSRIIRTIPGARHLSAPASHTVFERENLQPRVLVDLLEKKAGTWEEGPVVSFSSDGPMGALNWFYVSEVAGLDNILFFPEATRGWIDAGQLLGDGATTRN